MKTALRSGFLFAVSLIVCTQTGFAVNYTIESIGPSNDQSSVSRAWEINDNGQVTGQIWPDAIVSENGVNTFLPTPTSTFPATSRDINNNKDIAGWQTWSANTSNTTAAVWENNGGSYTQVVLPEIAGTNNSSAAAINNSGNIVGNYSTAATPWISTGILWTKNGAGSYTPTTITGGFAADINDNNQVAGYSSAGLPEAYIWDSTNGIQLLGKLDGALFSVAGAINNNGHVVGESNQKLFLHENGVMYDLGKPTGYTYVEAGVGMDINDNGQILFQAVFEDILNFTSITDSFLYENGTTQLIEDLLPANSGWSDITATGFNELGQIVGYGFYNDGEATQERGFIMTPDTMATTVPEPASLILLGLGLVGLIKKRMKK